MVAEHDDRVVGFMIYELNKTRIQILNFATELEERLEALLDGALDDVERRRCSRHLESCRACRELVEIAEMLGLPLGTVKSRSHRARLELAKVVRGLDPSYGG